MKLSGFISIILVYLITTSYSHSDHATERDSDWWQKIIEYESNQGIIKIMIKKEDFNNLQQIYTTTMIHQQTLNLIGSYQVQIFWK